MLYAMTLTFIFKVKHLLCIGYKKCAGSGCLRLFCLDSHAPAVELLFFRKLCHLKVKIKIKKQLVIFAGANCEQCLPSMYRPLSNKQTDANPCIACNCSGSGIGINPLTQLIGDCLMNNDSPPPNVGMVCIVCFDIRFLWLFYIITTLHIYLLKTIFFCIM